MRDRMLSNIPKVIPLLLALSGGAAGCSAQPVAEGQAWPKSLRIVGEGYPAAGDICRRIGETAATVDYLDDSSVLVGCPANSASAIQALVSRQRAREVGHVEGVTLLSVPAAGASASPGPPRPLGEAVDAKVAGTPFHAMAQAPCGGYRGHADGTCQAGVVRMTDGSAEVTIIYPGGADRRVIRLAPDGHVVEVALPDGAAGRLTARDLVVKRKGEDVTVIIAGPEHYEINDALLRGG